MKPIDRDISLHPGRRFVQTRARTSLMDQHLSQSAHCSSLMPFLESFVEPSSIKSNYSYLFQARCASLALCFGPLIVKRFSQRQEEIYEATSNGYYGLSIAVKLPLSFMGRVTFTLFAIRQSRQYLSFSLQWNVSLPKVVSHSAPIMRLARNGEIPAMEDLFKTGKASPYDVKFDGTSLLHVSFSSRFRFLWVSVDTL